MRPGSDRCIPASTSSTRLFRSTPSVILLLIGFVLAGPARASQGWLDFASDGRWLAMRQASAPQNGVGHHFELADLNHDGKLDFVANVRGGVQSALGNGDGTFQPNRYFGDAVSAAEGFALGDLNRDGIPDAVVGDSTGFTTCSVFLGDGSGGFGSRIAVNNIGLGHKSLALGDVNGDGKLDLAFAITVDGGGPYTVGVALGNGAGNFGVPTLYAESSPVSEVKLVDLDGDGNLDLLYIQSTPNQVCYRLGNGNGTFGAATRLATGNKITDVQTADLNRDGRLDLVWTRSGTTSDTTSIALGIPGGFAAPSTLVIPGDSQVLAIGDFNEDGIPDLVALLKDGRTFFSGIGDGTFGAPISRSGLPINFTLTNVVVTDLNRDGHLDIVYRLPAVDFGNGDGTFGAAQAMTTANGPAAAIFTRVDSDALPDLVVACRGTAMASLFLNVGGGSFLPRKDFPIGAGAAAIAAADFDGNSRNDIVTANQTAGTVSLLLNDGNKGFLPKTDFPVGTGPVALRAADLNGDGKMDLVVLNNTSATVSVLIGNGAGSFAPKVDYPVGNAGPTDIVVADFNNDGKKDIAIAGNFTGYPGLMIRFGNGDGTFGPETDLEWNKPKRALVAADFNKDGNIDLAASDLSFQVTVFMGNGNGTFGTGTVYTTTANAFTLEAADLDNDGNLDLLLGHSYGFFWALQGTPSGAFLDGTYGFAGRGTASLFPGHQIMAVGDWTLGGRQSVAIVGETSNSVTFLQNKGPAATPIPQAGWQPFQALTTQADPRGLAVADFNRDGRRDAAAAAAGPNEVALHLGDGMGSFSSETGFAASTSLRSLASGDLNRDGKPDAISVGQTGDLSVLLGDGHGNLGPKTDVASGGTSHSVALGDLDRDGILDAVLDDTGNSVLKAFHGVGDGTFGPPTVSPLPNGSGCSTADVALADINGDGKLDAVVATDDCGQVDVLFGNGALSFSGTSLTMGTRPDRVVIADFNNDGKPDLAASDLANGTVVVRLQDPSTPGAFLAPVTYPAIAGAGDLAAYDVDQDGDLDLLVGSSTLAQFAVLKNNGSGAFGAPTLFAVHDPVKSIAVDDLNHDGLNDVITAGSSATGNTISVLLGTRTAITGIDVPPVTAGYALSQNHPNPFNPVTKIRFAIGRSEPVRLRIFDAGGRLVATLVDQSLAAGTHEVAWTGKNQTGSPAASGVYFYKLETTEFSQARRMVLLK